MWGKPPVRIPFVFSVHRNDAEVSDHQVPAGYAIPGANFINPRRACAARVIVLGSVCVSVR